jgi:hypothetical protein
MEGRINDGSGAIFPVGLVLEATFFVDPGEEEISGSAGLVPSEDAFKSEDGV